MTFRQFLNMMFTEQIVNINPVLFVILYIFGCVISFIICLFVCHKKILNSASWSPLDSFAFWSCYWLPIVAWPLTIFSVIIIMPILHILTTPIRLVEKHAMNMKDKEDTLLL